MEKIAILGAGSWGTAIAVHLARNKHPVYFWDRDSEKLRSMREQRCNLNYLPDVKFPDSIHLCDTMDEAVVSCNDIFIAVPSAGFEECLNRLKPLLKPEHRLCWGSKGLIDGHCLHEFVTKILGNDINIAALSGPSFAKEVALGMPTAVTIASTDSKLADHYCKLFQSDTFRPYTSNDMIGIELGGVVKNVLAIAVGISDGMKYGANARAALITRGLSEMLRLGVAMGGEAKTFYGLAGVGDLILTATDNQSRNRRFGLALGEGLSTDDAIASVGQVVEGARNAKEIYQLAKKQNVEMPITEQVYKILYENLPAQLAVKNLLTRDAKAES